MINEEQAYLLLVLAGWVFYAIIRIKNPPADTDGD